MLYVLDLNLNLNDTRESTASNETTKDYSLVVLEAEIFEVILQYVPAYSFLYVVFTCNCLVMLAKGKLVPKQSLRD